MKTLVKIDEQRIDQAIAALASRGSSLNLKALALELGFHESWMYRRKPGREELKEYALARLDQLWKGGKRMTPIPQKCSELSSAQELILTLLAQRGSMSTERILMTLGAESSQACRAALRILRQMQSAQKIVRDVLYEDAWRLPGDRQLFVKRPQPKMAVRKDLALATWTPADAVRARKTYQASRAAMWGQDEVGDLF